MIKEITGISLLDEMYEIETRCFLSPWEKADIRDNLTKNNGVARFLGSFENEKLIGWSCVFLLGEEAHLASVAILPEYRGRGLGKELTNAICDLSAQEGTQYVQLECRRSNTVAQEMYKKLGFFKFSIRKGYYTDTGEDALLYARLNTGLGG